MDRLALNNVHYKYPGTKNEVLCGINATFPQGTITAIRGRSGAGKSTLLYLLSGLDVPCEGEILYEGKALTRSMLDDYRRRETATIAQSYLLFPTMTALENVLYPMKLAQKPKKEAMQAAKRFLSMVGIGEELFHRLPSKLSGGEQQRVAIARCLAADSKVIAADEPTGNLDEENADAVLTLLQNLAHEHGKTVIVVTHDSELARQCDRCYRLRCGVLDPMNED